MRLGATFRCRPCSPAAVKAPTAAGSISGTAYFDTNDPDESQIAIPISATAKTGIAEAYVTSVQLTNDNEMEPDDQLTSDPRVDFVVAGVFSGNARLEFDHDGDGVVD